tara:strand:- start:55 stop:504 length:450 start_codon:yes stop_codon:yes gene_type:complete
MRKLFISFVFFIHGFIFSQNIDSLRLKQFQKEIDSVEYSKNDFIKLKSHFNENEKILELISKKASSGDKNASDLLYLLSLSFEEANKKYGEKNIKILIYSHYKRVNTLKKFKTLDSTFQAKNDSLKLSKEFFEREIEKEKKILDSIRKN